VSQEQWQWQKGGVRWQAYAISLSEDVTPSRTIRQIRIHDDKLGYRKAVNEPPFLFGNASVNGGVAQTSCPMSLTFQTCFKQYTDQRLSQAESKLEAKIAQAQTALVKRMFTFYTRYGLECESLRGAFCRSNPTDAVS
jgi:hypothetical protein